MNRLPFLLLLVVGAIFISGCTAEKYAINQAIKNDWLASVGGNAGINVAGTWESLDSGWGTALFLQSGNRITGSLGNYTVEGRIAGRSLYLAMNSGGWTYYTAKLRMEGKRLEGFYSSSVPFSTADQYALNLYRP